MCFRVCLGLRKLFLVVLSLEALMRISVTSFSNVLTVLRVALIPVVVVVLLRDTTANNILAGTIFAVATVTDFVDGYLARAQDKVTTFGKLADPIADKLLICATLVSLVALGRLMPWVAVVIIVRELAVTALRFFALRKGAVISANAFGKTKTALQATAVFALIVVSGQPLWVELLLYLSVAVTVFSGVTYFRGWL